MAFELAKIVDLTNAVKFLWCYSDNLLKTQMQLTYSWFALALLAIAIPIIIHLLQLRRPQRLFFTNTAFIKEVELVTVRHRRLQQLLVLLARVLAIVGVVMMFCQPFIPAKIGQERKDKGVAMLVDKSFSMQAHGNGSSSLFESAKIDARDLGDLLPSNERPILISEGKGGLTATAFQTRLEAMRLSAGNSLIELGRLDADYDTNKALYVFSDFQRNSVSAKMLSTAVAGREAVLVPLVSKATSNIYTDSVWFDDAFVRVRTNVGLHVRLRNGGSVLASDCPVKVFLGGKQVAAFRVTMKPGEMLVSVVQVQVNEPALALGKVVTEDVPVTFDNTFYFTLQPASAIRILEIGMEPMTRSLYSNEPLFSYSFAKPQSVDYGTLRQASLVLVREVGQVDAGLRDGLRAALKRGASVVIVPPGEVAGRTSYEQLFRELGLGTVQWEAPVATPELREVAMPSTREPFFRDVFGAQTRAVSMPRVAPVFRWSRTGADILRLRDGESYLATFASGKGQVYVFSAPFAKTYSDFTAHALFVPVMYRMAMLSYRNEQLPMYRLTQNAVTLQLPNDASIATEKSDRASFRLVKDSLTLIPGQRVVGQEIHLELPKGMDTSGFYQVMRDGKVLTTLAFNQDSRESELAAYSADELRQMVGNNPKVQVLEDGVAGARLAQLQVEKTGQPLWRYFLLLALVALLAEALLVRFGNRKATAVKAAV